MLYLYHIIIEVFELRPKSLWFFSRYSRSLVEYLFENEYAVPQHKLLYMKEIRIKAKKRK